MCQAVRESAARVVQTTCEDHDDAEAIHDYRVALRRLRSLLAASGALFKRGALKQAQQRLRGFAQVAGAVRDEEVLREVLSDFPLPPTTRERVDAWLASRARREKRLRRAVVRTLGASEIFQPDAPPVPGIDPDSSPIDCAAPREINVAADGLLQLLTVIENLPLRRKSSAISTRALAFDALRNTARRTKHEASHDKAQTPAARHRLRIRWKRVRYTAELFLPSFAGESRTSRTLEQLIKAATRMQKRLGDLHDLDEAIARITRARSLSPGDRMVVHHRLRMQREKLAERLSRELPAALSHLPD